MAMAELQDLPGQMDAQGLRQAFDQFNDMSRQLSDSYSLLEDRVAELTGELDDVSQQRLLELAEKERLADRLESLLNLLPGGVIVLDGNGYIAQANPAAIELLQHSFNQGSVQQGSFQQDSFQKGAVQNQALQNLIGIPWVKVIRQCFQPRDDDGHEVSTTDGRRLSIATRSLETEPGQLILLTDLTETRQLQEKLSQHQRLSSMGRMVASLAHQIRTPLSAAMLYAGHLNEETLEDDLRLRFAEKTMQRLGNIEQQIRDMLVFSKGQAPLTDLLSIQQFKQRFSEMVEDILVRHNATCEWQVEESDLKLRCSQDTLIGALLNLVNNALEAGANAITISLLNNKNNLEVCIKDNGPGMDQQTQQRLFEPFFTTKSKGTGLGLSVVQAVIRAHYGNIDVQSNLGKGSQFSVLLPLQAAGDIK